MTPNATAFTDRHHRNLQAIRECSKTAGPRPGEAVGDWIIRRFRETMAGHLAERIAERNLTSGDL